MLYTRALQNILLGFYSGRILYSYLAEYEQSFNRTTVTLVKKKMVKKGKAVRELHLTATGNHIPYGITQCYLPPGRGDFPAFTPAEAGTQFSDPEGMQG